LACCFGRPFRSVTVWVKLARAVWVSWMKVRRRSIVAACATSAMTHMKMTRELLNMIAASRWSPSLSKEAAVRGAKRAANSVDTTPRQRPHPNSTRLLLADRHQDFAVTVGLHRRDESRALHLLDQPRRPVVADPQMALNQRDRRPPGLEYDRHRLIVHRIRL